MIQLACTAACSLPVSSPASDGGASFGEKSASRARHARTYDEG